MRHKLAVLVGFLAASMSAPAFASIRYDFTALSAYSGPTGTFSYTSPNFITSNSTAPVGQLNSCTPTSGVCGDQYFKVNYPLSGGPSDIVLFNVNDNSNYYYFAGGSLGALGTYNTVIFQGLQDGTLTVSNVADTAVPEPATWAMMLLGFGGIGVTMRRSRRRNSALLQVA